MTPTYKMLKKCNNTHLREAYLVAKFGTLILLQLSFRLSEIILDKVQKHVVIFFGDARIM